MGEDGQGKGQTRLGTLRPGQEREGCYMAEKAEDVQLKSPEGTVRKQKKEQWKKKETEIRRPAGSLQEPGATSLNGASWWSVLAWTTPAWVAGSLAS